MWTDTDATTSDYAQEGCAAQTPFAALSPPAWLGALPCPAAIIRWHDDEPRFDQWNKQFENRFGLLADRSIGHRPGWVRQLLDQISAFVASGKESGRFELERPASLGADVFACSLGRIPEFSAASYTILLTAIDRTAERRIEESLRRELVSDTLTALPNRIGFGEAVEAMLERDFSQDIRVGVLIVDVKRFGLINEALGAMAGDELILSVASRLKAAVGQDITLARLGGNEFGICFVTADGMAAAVDLAESVRAAISAPIRLSNLEISIDCVIGCSLAAGRMDADELIRQAQRAARAAKRTGKLEIYRPGELGFARRRFMLESRLRDALASDQLHLRYQPIIELATSSVVGFEALARWRDPKFGVISPKDFIPVAEESGLIVKLGQWALAEATQQLRRWDALYGGAVPLKMNVNLSPIQIVRDDVIAMIDDALTHSGIEGRRLTMELTESAVVADPENSRRLLEALKRFDVAIAMDDFGTGYSNMASLQSLPIDVLKIDRSFVTNMLSDPDKLAIIRAILSLAETLGMQTTAEGIEDARVAATLRELGCTFGQGFHFARPLSAAEAYDCWLSRLN